MAEEKIVETIEGTPWAKLVKVSETFRNMTANQITQSNRGKFALSVDFDALVAIGKADRIIRTGHRYLANLKVAEMRRRESGAFPPPDLSDTDLEVVIDLLRTTLDLYIPKGPEK